MFNVAWVTLVYIWLYGIGHVAEGVAGEVPHLGNLSGAPNTTKLMKVRLWAQCPVDFQSTGTHLARPGPGFHRSQQSQGSRSWPVACSAFEPCVRPRLIWRCPRGGPRLIHVGIFFYVEICEGTYRSFLSRQAGHGNP